MPDIELKNVVKAVDDINTAFEAMKAANEERLAEIEKKGEGDPLLADKISRMEADLAKASEIADAAALAVKRQSRVVTDAKGEAINLDQKALDWARMNAKRHGSDIREYTAADLDQYKAAFDRYLRKDDRVLSADEAKALSVGSDPDGGYLVHPDMSGRITARIYETSPVRAYASVQVISTDALEGVIDNDEISSGWVNETEARAVTDTPEVGTWRIPVHEMYAKPQATQKLLDDASINIEQWLSGKVADHFSRKENTAFVTGSGVGQPRGFMTYDDWTTAGTFEHGKIEQFDTGVSGDFAAAPNGLDTLITALYALKMQYRQNATWFMNRSTLGAARLEKDSNGAYVWAPGAVGQPSTFFGYPVADFEDMADIAASSLSIAVGDLRAAYQIVDRVGIRTLRDPYSNKPYVQFYTTKRVGGDVVNFEALKIIKFIN